MKIAGWIILALVIVAVMKSSRPQTTTPGNSTQLSSPFGNSFLGNLFGSFQTQRATDAGGQPVTAAWLPSDLLSSDFGGTATPTAANDPIGLAIGAVPTPSGIPGLSGGTPLVNGQIPAAGAPSLGPDGVWYDANGNPMSPAPGDIQQGNTAAAKAAAATDTNTVTGNVTPPVDMSGDLVGLGEFFA